MWGIIFLIIAAIVYFSKDKTEPPSRDPLWEDPYFMAMIIEEENDICD